jgi:branched-subunit amino acid transport protein
LNIWLVLVAMGLATYATRALPLLIVWRHPHPLLGRVLHYMPPAIFAALIVPSILTPSGSWIEISSTLWAGLAGALVAWRTRSMILTIIAGLAAFTLAGLF